MAPTTAEQAMASRAPPHSSQSSLTSYDDDDIDDDAWANFDLSGAIDQHQRCSSSQPTATLGRSSPTQFAGAATTCAAASSMCDDDIDDDAWANFDLSGAIEQYRRSMGSQPTAATAPCAALFPHAGRAGTNPRALGTNPRALGTNPRALGTNPMALGTNPRAQG